MEGVGVRFVREILGSERNFSHLCHCRAWHYHRCSRGRRFSEENSYVELSGAEVERERLMKSED